MAVNHSRFLKPMYARENPLRALGAEATRIENQNGIFVLRCNVGDPTGPTLAASNWAMAEYVLTRPEGTGYTDHTGEPGLRKVVAEQIGKLNRLPAGTLDANKIFCVAGGTGGLNTALSIFDDANTQVLVSDPFYPPWEPITARNNLRMVRFPLRCEDDYLLNEYILREKIKAANTEHPVILMYHYPHNPTGKALTQNDALQVAQTLNYLTEEFPNLYLLQEDLYLATIKSDMGVYTPMQYLSPDALERTILVHSPSKEGHGQDRGAIVATPSTEIALRLRGSTAFSSLGMSTGSLVGTARTLIDIANGIEPWAGNNERNHRYVTADYYQNRTRALGQGFIELENVTGQKILDRGIPDGTYYLWPKLDFLRGLPVPLELQEAISEGGESAYGPEFINSGHDLMQIFARAHRIGLVPVMMTPGDFFTDTNTELRMRLAAVDRDLARLHEGANTIKGVIGKLLGIDLRTLGVKVRSTVELKKDFPPICQSTSAINIDEPMSPRALIAVIEQRYMS